MKIIKTFGLAVEVFDLLFVGINVAVVDVDVFVADLLYIGASVVVANVVEVPFV